MEEFISVLTAIEETPSTHDPKLDFATQLDGAFHTYYPDLKRIAHARLSGTKLSNGLETTALVHESYIKLVQGHGVNFVDRVRFLAYAARVIRSVMMDVIREQQAAKRGAGMDIVTLNTDMMEGVAAPVDVEVVNVAVDELAALDPALARLVEMRFFGGLTEAEIAAATNSSERTVRREWQRARMLLLTLIQK